MENLGFGQILLLFLFILAPLINFAMRRIRKSVESETPADKPVLDTHRRARATPKSSPPTPRASRNEVRASQAPTAIPLSRGRFSKRSLLWTTRDARHGIILMTVLGPCRASDSPESRRVENVLQVGPQSI